MPEFYFWVDWIKGKPGYKFGANRVPSGSFDDPKAMTEAGWVNVDHEFDGITAKMSTVPREGKPGDRMIRMSVEPKNKEELDNNLPFFDFPVAAIRTPAIKADAKNLIRISVQVKRSIASTPGMGGIIVRDSLGGEQLQYRTSDPIPSFSRIVIYRKAPTDCSFTVTFGLAGYGEAFFDDFRVELVEADEASGGSDIAQRRQTGRLVNLPLPIPRSRPRQPAPPVPVPVGSSFRSCAATRPIKLKARVCLSEPGGNGQGSVGPPRSHRCIKGHLSTQPPGASAPPTAAPGPRRSGSPDRDSLPPSRR